MSPRQHGWSRIGCAFWSTVAFVVLVGLAALLTSLVVRIDDSTLAGGIALLSIYAICAVGALAVVHYGYARHRKRSIENLRRERANEAATRASALSARASLILSQSQAIIDNLPRHLEQARNYLALAQEDFKARAFSPFWGQIENAAVWVVRFHESARQLADLSKEYHGCLRGKGHNFPPFPAQEDSLLNFEPLIAELRSTVRSGHTDFEFASIWVQRRTNKGKLLEQAMDADLSLIMLEIQSS